MPKFEQYSRIRKRLVTTEFFHTFVLISVGVAPVKHRQQRNVWTNLNCDWTLSYAATYLKFCYSVSLS